MLTVKQWKKTDNSGLLNFKAKNIKIKIKQENSLPSSFCTNNPLPFP